MRAAARIAAAALSALGLAGCFDYHQSVDIGRDGSGRIEVEIAADAAFADILRSQRVLRTQSDEHRVVAREKLEAGRYKRIERLTFDRLDEIVLENEVISIKVTEDGWFDSGIGPVSAVFRRTALQPDADADLGPLVAGALAERFYRFSVTLPGSVDQVTPVVVNGLVVEPEESGGFFGRTTLTWTIPLSLLLGEDRLVFEVAFSTWGGIADAQSRTPQELAIPRN